MARTLYSACWKAAPKLLRMDMYMILNKRHGGDKIYAGHYGPVENKMQLMMGYDAMEINFPVP